MMQVQVNGRAKDVATGTTVTELIEAHDLVPRYVVVELNGEALERREYDATELVDGDRVELVRAVAGGARDLHWRRERLANSRIYCCTDRRADQGDLETFLDAILGAGVDVVQLRDKHATSRELADAAAVFRASTLRHDALFIMNDDPQLAADVDADGVHVGQEDPGPAAARATVGPERLVGRSTHGADQIDAALTEDCDYFAIGPVHATPTKEGRQPIGFDPVRYAAEHADRPWFVTGGMAVETAPEVLAVGAQGLVVVRAITDADNPAGAVVDLRRVLEAAQLG